jgi:hypothetical protein
MTRRQHPRGFIRVGAAGALALVLTAGLAAPADAQNKITARAREVTTPAWDKGILPISSESYYNAIDCGKLGGDDPPCVFWDKGLCENPDFALALYTPYKAVAYEVWQAVRRMQPAPTPNYRQAQQTRITVGVTPVRGSKNPLKDLRLLRGGKPVAPVARSVATGDARFTFDYPAFAATSGITLELAGSAGTLTCTIPQSVMARFR